jgi:predicted MFS family arabinose efflux permease
LPAAGFITHVSVIGFATALSTRAVDPIIPPIAESLHTDPGRVVLLTTAFTLPFVIAQPFMGPVADAIGKLRTMLGCLVIIIAMSIACALATSFEVLVAARIVCGAVTGGIYPIAMAMISDAVPIEQRQVGMARWAAIVTMGNLLGTAFSGGIADLLGWRAVFVGIALCSLAALTNALVNLRGVGQARSGRLDLASMPASYLALFDNPRAKFCFLAVFLEGVAIFGLFSFVALLLVAAGEPRSSIAGFVIGAFSVGGIAYTLAVTPITRRWQPHQLMLAGGAVCLAAFVGVALHPVWQIQIVLYAAMGIGFYMLHTCIQVEATELTPTARGTAMSMHSLSFFMGMAVGPVLYSIGFAWLGAGPSVLIGGAVVMLTALMCAHTLRRRAGV